MVNVMELLEDAYCRSIIFSIICFTIMQFVVPVVLQTLHPSWWKNLPEKKRIEIPPCMVGLMHHFIVVPFSFYLLYNYFVYGTFITYAQILYLSPFTCAYLAVDTVFYAMVEAKGGNYEYLVHHVLGVWISITLSAAKSGPMLAMIPSILLTELSTIFFAIGWIMRSTSYKSSPIITYLEMIFAICFFFTRIINLPWSVFNAWSTSEEMGPSRFFLLPIVGLQFFWFTKIVMSVLKKGGNAKKNEVKAE